MLELSASHFICLRSKHDKLVYFGHRVVGYSLYNATKVDKTHKKCQRRFAFRHFVYLVNSLAMTAQKDSSKFTTIAVHVVDNLCISCPLFHLCNAA